MIFDFKNSNFPPVFRPEPAVSSVFCTHTVAHDVLYKVKFVLYKGIILMYNTSVAYANFASFASN